MKNILVVRGCGDTNGRPRIAETDQLEHAREFGRTIYADGGATAQ